MTNLVKVLIYERRPRYAIALTTLLERSKFVCVVARAQSTEELIAAIKISQPHVVVVGETRSGQPLKELSTDLHQNHRLGVVLIANDNISEPVRGALDAGACSILPRNFHPRDLMLAVIHGAMISQRAGSLEMLSNMECTIKADEDLSTGRLRPVMNWARNSPTEKVSPRLTGRLSEFDTWPEMYHSEQGNAIG
ncbi:MAG: hypothetical protein ABJA50_12945 [Chloroflexota bacterium]